MKAQSKILSDRLNQLLHCIRLYYLKNLREKSYCLNCLHHDKMTNVLLFINILLSNAINVF